MTSGFVSSAMGTVLRKGPTPESIPLLVTYRQYAGDNVTVNGIRYAHPDAHASPICRTMSKRW